MGVLGRVGAWIQGMDTTVNELALRADSATPKLPLQVGAGKVGAEKVGASSLQLSTEDRAGKATSGQRGCMPYLQYWHGTWRVRMPIPKALQAAVGRGAYLTRSLKTKDKQEANRLAAPVISEFQEILEHAAAGEAPLYSVRDSFGIRMSRCPHDTVNPILQIGERTDSQFSGVSAQTSVGTLGVDLTNRVVSIKTILDLWAIERGHVHTRAKHVAAVKMGKFAEFVGTDNMAAIKDTDIVRWKEHLLSIELKPGTILNYWKITKTIFTFAFNNRKINHNPTTGISLRIISNPLEDKLPFTREETATILQHAMNTDKPTIKWGNMLAAYTGARAEEIIGANVSDFEEVDGHLCLVIRLNNRIKGASLKNRSSHRTIPLHRDLINHGFVDYLRTLPRGGSLFPQLNPNKYGCKSSTFCPNVSMWLRRTVGITDKHKTFHSHRHSFKTYARMAGIQEEIHDKLTGHSGGSSRQVSRGYGTYDIATLARAIDQLPSLLAAV